MVGDIVLLIIIIYYYAEESHRDDRAAERKELKNTNKAYTGYAYKTGKSCRTSAEY